MKYIIVLAAGLADEPAVELDNHTPLEVARTPVLDKLGCRGRMGRVMSLPQGLPASEEVALISIMGYDPHIHFTGEAGLSAAGILQRVPEDRVPFVHNLATEANGMMVDHAAGHITPKEAEALLKTLARALDKQGVEFHAGTGFSGITLMSLPENVAPECLPPEEALGRAIEKCLPKGKGAGADTLREIIRTSREVFLEHDVNRVRTDLGENPATILWPWGPGHPPELPSFESRYGLQATMIADTPFARGFAKLSGMALFDAQDVEDPDTDLCVAAAQHAIDALALYDLVVIHTTAAAEASLEGDIQGKVAIAHEIDTHLLAPLLDYVNENEFTRLLFMPTNIASTTQRRRLHAPVPAVMCGPGFNSLRSAPFTEAAIDDAQVVVERSHELMEYFLRT